MTVRFTHDLRSDGVLITADEKRLLGRKPVMAGEWMALPAPVGNAAKTLHRLVKEGDARSEHDGIFLPNETASRLAPTVADALALPPLASLSATLSFEGKMTDSDARIRVRWYDANLSTIRIERRGSFAVWGDKRARLVRSVFELMEAIDAYNASVGGAPDVRIAAWGPVQAALKRTTGETIRSDDNFLKSLSVYQAGAFALDVRETTNGPDFVPVVMGREKATVEEDDAPIGKGADDETVPGARRDQVDDALLPPDLQRRFVNDFFSQEARTRDGYVLARNTYLVVDEDLKGALDVVREKRRAPAAERRAFVRNPRPAIAQSLGEGRESVAGALFVETAQYSERVLGLGVWQPPALPWLKNKAGQWLPESFPLRIGDRTIEMNRDRFEAITKDVAEAKAAEKGEILLEDVPTPVAAVEEALSAFQRPEPASATPAIEEEEPGDDGARETEAATAPQHVPKTDREVLLISQNLEGVDYEVAWPKREAATAGEFPLDDLARTQPKPHQVDGFDWLVDAWKAGWPGVLLADDMGLGKTFQALAFLAWVRKNRMRLGLNEGAAKEPILVVAPTALLRNWAEESERHLAPGALGTRIDAFGSGLRRLKAEKRPDLTPEDALDVQRIREADWVLTTYETLANYHRAFARVAFSVAVFDEAQKIKAPGAINTQSAKAMNADFVLALTGTPIENRLTDLWCIMDRVVPGYLGELKSFAKTYEEGGPAELEELKARLDRPSPATPAVLLRRMKADILTGLPAKTVEASRIAMPPAQAEAYEKAVAAARMGERKQSDMLKAIHAFRGISLHPDGTDGLDPLDPRSVDAWIARSARMAHTVTCLENIAARKEKVLVFLEDRAVQSAFASAIATRFKLPAEPEIINGAVPGDRRLEIVDRFQAGPSGFSLLVLSPKAAGVGLTITAANHVIHLSRWWNPAVEDQCNDRVYRIGQERPVTIHVPIATHPGFGDATFDVTLDALLEKKRSLSRHMLMPPVEDGDLDALFGSAVDGRAMAA
ncbi:DEAD/DEAH box helicase [Jiella marina]|uniref:DEAD/DEAH box helicase n=1 Tax=Jiella sp. LLJ827 TaxID=2917712 RepID=UPI00210092FC|nr:DEAD/DEAH box helicase [Jiella sp. LLJ827]MCQ0987165.1 DEAD/DEAH box helicase [Jiella sp. LLJ827]